MRFLGQLYTQAKTPAERQTLRAQSTDFVRIRGTSMKPPPPREVQIQSAPRGLYITWSLPDPTDPMTALIAGWRVYKDNESTLYDEIRDRGTRQKFIESTSGSTPPVTNVFVSSINGLGVESVLVHATGSAIAESGAPSMPSTPPGYNDTYSGGSNKDSGSGNQLVIY